MRAELLMVGTELLIGQVVDTNATLLAQSLAGVGVDCHYKTTVGDNWLRIAAAFGQALSRADVVITSGGLGPTGDDLTKEVVAAVMGEGLELHAESLHHIEEILKRRGRPLSDGQRKQALLPRAAVPIPNPRGTAPGVLLEKGGKTVICLPGVPVELRGMLDEWVLPYLRRRVDQEGRAVIRSRILRFCGIGEATLEDRLKDLMGAQSNPTIAPYAGLGEVSLRLTAKAETEDAALAALIPVEAEIRSRLSRFLYGVDHQTLEEVAGRLLAARELKIVTAESCTGGLIAHRLTNIPGSSDYVDRAFVVYSNEAKHKLLGVKWDTLAEFGAVSEETAVEMAIGAQAAVRRTSAGEDRTVVGLSVTGIAGPGGETSTKPVGRVHMAISGPLGVWHEQHDFSGDRHMVKQRAAQAALDMLRRYLLRGQRMGA